MNHLEREDVDRESEEYERELDEIIQKILDGKNGEKFRRLMDGDISEYHNPRYAGCALVGFLRSPCNDNESLIKDIFVQSDLLRFAPWNEDIEIWKAIKDLLKTPIMKPSKVSSRGGRSADEDKAEDFEEPEAFEEPLCLEQTKQTTFPVAAFPTDIANYVNAVASSRKVSPDLPAMLVLGATAAAAAKKFKVSIGSSHEEPVNLYILPAAETAERKSSVFDDIFFPVEQEEKRLVEEGKGDFHRACQEFEITKRRIEIIQKDAAKAKEEKEREKLLSEAARLSSSLKEPVCPKLIVGGDITPEALSTKLLQQGGKIVLLDTEGGFFQKINGQYAKNGQANLDAVLKGHSGTDRIRVSRQGRADEFVDKPELTLVICVQPIVIKNLAQNGDFRGKGLLTRFLYSFPPSLAGTRLYDTDSPVNHDAKFRYKEIIDGIFKIKAPEENYELDYSPEKKLKITGSALSAWKNIHDKVELQLGKSGQLHEIADWCGKYAGLVARISGLLHILDNVLTDKIPDQIPEEIIIRAGQIGEYLLENAKTAYGLMGAKKDFPRALQIMAWIKNKNKTEFTGNDILRDNSHWENVEENILPSLMLLSDRNIISPVSPKSMGRGRPAKYKFRLNPACAGCNKCLESTRSNKKGK